MKDEQTQKGHNVASKDFFTIYVDSNTLVRLQRAAKKNRRTQVGQIRAMLDVEEK